MKKKALFYRFLLATIVHILLVAVSAVVLLKQKHGLLDAYLDQVVKTQTQNLENDLSIPISDLYSQGEHREIARIVQGWILGENLVESKSELKKELLAFSYYKQFYDQVRLLNSLGDEVIRINQGEREAVVDSLLQNKRNRYYFRESMKRLPGEVYMSPFDLNIEQGKIEKPFKPMIRFALSLGDSTGKSQGSLIFNYEGSYILRRFQKVLDRESVLSWLVNQDGYWISSGDSTLDWGFMKPGGEKNNLQLLYPEIWRRIQISDEGHMHSRLGDLSWQTVYPEQILRDVRSGRVLLFENPESSDKFLSSHPPRGRSWKVIAIGNASLNWSLGQNIFFASIFVLFELGIYFILRRQLRLSQLKKRERELLEKLANEDPLTELPNRRAFFRTLDSEVARSHRYMHPMCVVMFDLDHFKQVNDSFGHEEGDRVIKTFCGVLLKGIRDCDLVARVGGEEFALILPDTDLSGARILLERIRAAVASCTPEGDAVPCTFTVSIGVVQLKKDENGQHCLMRSDEALYLAKEGGRNRVHTKV